MASGLKQGVRAGHWLAVMLVLGWLLAGCEERPPPVDAGVYIGTVAGVSEATDRLRVALDTGETAELNIDDETALDIENETAPIALDELAQDDRVRVRVALDAGINRAEQITLLP